MTISAWCLFQRHWRGTSLQELRNYSTHHLTGRKDQERFYLAGFSWFSSKCIVIGFWNLTSFWTRLLAPVLTTLGLSPAQKPLKPSLFQTSDVPTDPWEREVFSLEVLSVKVSRRSHLWAFWRSHVAGTGPPQHANFSGPCFFCHLANENFNACRSQFNQCGWMSYVDNITNDANVCQKWHGLRGVSVFGFNPWTAYDGLMRSPFRSSVGASIWE